MRLGRGNRISSLSDILGKSTYHDPHPRRYFFNVMAELVVFRKGVKHVILYDDDMHNLICEYKWCISDNGYATAKNKSTGMKNIRMHRLVLGILDTPSILCDHKDQNKLNNCVNNLRHCNKSENGRNKKSCGKVPYLGVHPVNTKIGVRYIASIQHEGARQLIGRYSSPELAAYARDSVARELHGEFAALNFPGINIFPEREDKSRCSRGKTKYRGVYVSGKKFTAQIRVQGILRGLGTFNDAISAAKAFNAACVEAYGEFAVLNKV